MIVTFVNRPICGNCLKEMQISFLTPRQDERDYVIFYCSTIACKFENKKIKISIERKNSNG